MWQLPRLKFPAPHPRALYACFYSCSHKRGAVLYSASPRFSICGGLSGCVLSCLHWRRGAPKARARLQVLFWARLPVASPGGRLRKRHGEAQRRPGWCSSRWPGAQEDGNSTQPARAQPAGHKLSRKLALVLPSPIQLLFLRSPARFEFQTDS